MKGKAREIKEESEKVSKQLSKLERNKNNETMK